MNVLFLTSRVPYPPHSGGQLAQFETLRRLSESVDIHLRVVSAYFETDMRGCPTMERYCASVKLFAADPELPHAAIRELPQRVADHRCPAMRREITYLLASGRIDLVHVQGYYMVQHLPDDTGVPVLLFEENIEYLLDCDRHRLRLAGPDEPPWTVSRELERAAWRRATACAAVSEADLAQMAADEPGLRLRLLPDGWDHLRAGNRDAPAGAAAGPRVGFVGNYSWPPTEDGAVFLLERIWPRIRAQAATAELVLVGASPSTRMLALAREEDGVTVTGTVPSIGPWLATMDVFLCPLRVGSGIKVKMIEALSSGCAVVSTSVGAQGLPAAIRDSLVLADDPADLVAATVTLLDDADARGKLGAQARSVASALPSWDDAAATIRRCWAEFAKASREPAGS